MKRLFLILVLIFFNLLKTSAQGMTQSASGKSTIPIKGSAVAIDLAETELSFGYNNINRSIQTQKLKGIYGAEVKVKNEGGIGNLFTAGDLVPKSSLNIFAGFTLSNLFSKKNQQDAQQVDDLLAKFRTYRQHFDSLARMDFKTFIQAATLNMPSDRQTKIRTSLNELLDKTSYAEEFYDSVSVAVPDGPEEILFYQGLKSHIKSYLQPYTLEKEKYAKEMKSHYDKFQTGHFQRLTFFGFGGISSISFKKFNGVDSTALASSFENIKDRGGNIGLGINYQSGNIWAGVTYSYVSTNNFENLSKTDYTIRSSTTIGGQSLIDETKITGYTGKYGKVELNNLNADLIFRVKLDKGDKNAVLINPYLRASIFSRDTSLLPNKTDLGSGFYFLQGKFLGGFYIELPDINNNAEKSKPIDKQNIRDPFNKLTFGIVTKFNISSIMAW